MKKVFCKKIISFLPLAAVFLSSFAIDRIVKILTLQYVPSNFSVFLEYPYGGVGVFYTPYFSFSIINIVNRGAAWGIFSSHFFLLNLFRVFLVIFLFGYLIKAEKIYRYPIIFILSGALGNLLDAILYSHVVDMFHLRFYHYSFPIFNVADISISIGITWLFFLYLFQKPQREE